MTELSSGLEKFDLGAPNWHYIHNKNMHLLITQLLKLANLQNVNKKYLQQDCILVWDENASEWRGKKFRKKLGEGPCKFDEEFSGTNGNPPNPKRWAITSGSPNIQDNKLELVTSAGSTEEIKSTWWLAHTSGAKFEIYVFFEVPEVNVNEWALYLRFYVEASRYFDVRVGYRSSAKFFGLKVRSAAGTSYTYESRTKNKGIIRISANGETMTAWFRDGIGDFPQWKPVYKKAFNISSILTQGTVRMGIEASDNNPSVTAYFDGFKVARGCSYSVITTTTTTTTTV